METNSNTYLMMLYVTLEQESALRDYFVEQGWMFCKPDMSVTTDALGPSVPFKHDPDEETGTPDEDFMPLVKPSFPKIRITTRSSSKLSTKKPSGPKKRKRKALSLPRKPATSAKVAKEAHDTTVGDSGELDENTDTEEAENSKTESNIKRSCVPQNALDGTELPVKVEKEVGGDQDFDYTGEILDEESYGDEDDDFRDTEMDNDIEEEASESVGIASFKEETQSHADDTVVNQIVSDFNATYKDSKNSKKKNNEPIICTLCFKTFSCKSNLSKHMKRHGEKKFICHVCSKGFYRLDEVKQHTMFVHEGRSPSIHICDVCGKMYKSKSGLQVHYAYKHGTEEADDLKCKVCDKILSCKKKRMDHERKHVEGFKFTKCELCGRMSKNLEEHKMYCSQAPVTEKQKCGDCGAMFIDQKYLEKHMRRKHGFSYKCVACGVTFSSKKEVMDHTSKCFNIVIAEALGEDFL